MGLKEKLFKVLNKAKDELTDEDKAQIKTLLESAGTEYTEDSEKTAKQNTAEETEAEDEEAEGKIDETELSETAVSEAETGPDEESTSVTKKPPDTQATDEVSKVDASIPSMEKGAMQIGEDSGETDVSEQSAQEQSAPLQDEEGEELPVDYQQIIEALIAKNMALEAENTKLKAKTEGAFGLSSKPGEFAKVNPLYDNDISDIHFKK